MVHPHARGFRGINSSVSLLNKSHPFSIQQNSIKLYELFSHTEVLDSINICVSASFFSKECKMFLLYHHSNSKVS